MFEKFSPHLCVLLWLLASLAETSARSNRLLLPRGQHGDISHYINNIPAIQDDLMNNKNPKEDCVFYVNSYNSTREKNAAIAFAFIRNSQSGSAGGREDANTLYDAFDLDVAFGNGGTLMREAAAGGPAFQRTYFKVTSAAYAHLCRGTVWLIVKKGTPIYEDAIWLTHEYPQLIRPGSGVTAIYEIDPADVEWAQLEFDHNPNPNFHPSLYRGGQPPGAQPPRASDPIPYKWKDAKGAQARIKKYDAYPDVSNGYLPPSKPLSPKCDMSKSSRVPYNVFTGVYSRFCDATLENPLRSLAQIVDSHGYKIGPRRRMLAKRTPPPDPNQYYAYRFTLTWTGGKGTCSASCVDAFSAAASSPCGHSAGEQNIMTTSGSIDAGCGEYKWSIKHD